MSAISNAQRQVQTNDPEVRPGQLWSERAMRRYQLRVICAYPFVEPQDGRIWVVEVVGSVDRLMRVPELILRERYWLKRDVPA